ncbi:MAG: SpoIIE family protein phosphatase [Bacteroidota bacterium]
MDQVKEITKAEFFQVQKEKEELAEELNGLKLYFSELEATNNHLVSATWRERDMKKKLAETIGELNSTKIILDNQNRRITESINYSKKIQSAINPTEEDIRKHHPNSFMLYMPKDVISGDFPWTHENGDNFYIASVDCTGHGVPGAMMSMIGNLLLKQIVNEEVVHEPSVILKKLHDAVVKTLRQDESNSNSNDGMDIGLCRINKTKNEISFSGAHRPLFLMRNNEIEVISGDKFPIGGMHYRGKNNYSDFVFNYLKGDSIFLFTDGLPDQVGGSENKKLMTKNLKLFLQANAHLAMEPLKNELSAFLTNWKGDNKQVDDILIIGINF